jgi:ABC-2 type transport system ATP-binding protein
MLVADIDDEGTFRVGTLLQASNLVKHYNGVHAVDGVDLSLRTGTCFGLLGPNGAGKTTIIEMLEGIKTPTGGEILYKGKPIGAQFRAEAGIMFQATALQDFITVREALRLFGRFYAHTAPIELLIDICALGEFLDRDARKLSGGQRQRVLLAIALVNDPQILFLDEPTTGLDPQARRNLWALVRRIKAQGKTILLTTHYMEEAYELCDEIAIMDHGRVIARGSPAALLAEQFTEVVLTLPLRDLRGSALTLPHTVIDDRVQILSGDVTASVRKLLEHGASLDGLQIRPRTLEDLFLQLTGEALRA